MIIFENKANRTIRGVLERSESFAQVRIRSAYLSARSAKVRVPALGVRPAHPASLCAPHCPLHILLAYAHRAALMRITFAGCASCCAVRWACSSAARLVLHSSGVLSQVGSLDQIQSCS